MKKIESVLFASLSEVIEFRDVTNDGHILRTKKYLERMIRTLLKISNPYKREISRWKVKDHVSASQLHDIGKIGVPDHILVKNDKLTKEEFEIIKQHVPIGVNIINHLIKKLNNKELLIARKYIISHHEYWDGSGYPYGLSGTDIPLEGRIMAIVDTYDALISKRIYKDPISHSESCRIIRNDSGIKFDPELIRIFFLISDKFEDIVNETI